MSVFSSFYTHETSVVKFFLLLLRRHPSPVTPCFSFSLFHHHGFIIRRSLEAATI